MAGPGAVWYNPVAAAAQLQSGAAPAEPTKVNLMVVLGALASFLLFI
jgi:hypothetical protein